MPFLTILSIISIFAPSMAAQRERTLILIKPDGLQRGLVGKIIRRFESKGLKTVAMKLIEPSEELLKEHYKELVEKSFYNGLIKYMKSGPVLAMIWEGVEVVKISRDMIGATDPKLAAPGTIRGDFCIQPGRNAIHGSDSVQSAKREIKLWFKNNEIVSWNPAIDSWVYGEN